jgi:hypothetical protein
VGRYFEELFQEGVTGWAVDVKYRGRLRETVGFQDRGCYSTRAIFWALELSIRQPMLLVEASHESFLDLPSPRF